MANATVLVDLSDQIRADERPDHIGLLTFGGGALLAAQGRSWKSKEPTQAPIGEVAPMAEGRGAFLLTGTQRLRRGKNRISPPLVCLPEILEQFPLLAAQYPLVIQAQQLHRRHRAEGVSEHPRLLQPHSADTLLVDAYHLRPRRRTPGAGRHCQGLGRQGLCADPNPVPPWDLYVRKNITNGECVSECAAFERTDFYYM